MGPHKKDERAFLDHLRETIGNVEISLGLNMIIYDPFEGVSSAMQRGNQGLGKGVVEMATSRALEYWQSALDNSWMFWIKKETPKSQPLETYLGQAGAVIR